MSLENIAADAMDDYYSSHDVGESDERYKRIEKYKEKVELIIKANDAGCVSLTDWESGFIDSIYFKLEDDKDLSWKQSKSLNSILEKIE